MTIFVMIDLSNYNGLSKRELALVAAWERSRKAYVTTADLRVVSEKHAAQIAYELVRKRILRRVRRGVWMFRPIRMLVHPSSASAVVELAALLHDVPHYIGGLWALSHHGMTTQRYLALDAFLTRHRASRRVGTTKARFHVVPSRALTYGLETATIEATAVRVADRERTLLDLLDHPRTVGGIRRAVTIVEPCIARVDVEKLLAHAIRGSRPSTCQRIGVLLEREGISKKVLAPLNEHVRQTRSLTSMVSGRRRGVVNKIWRVVENDR